jgi:hypothetical protein
MGDYDFLHVARVRFTTLPPANPFTRIDYAKELNEQQHAAVTAPPGPALVIAGAGSGKTRTLTYRVAFLLEQGIPPESHPAADLHQQGGQGNDAPRADLLGGELISLVGRHFSFHRRPRVAPPRGVARLPAGFFHPGPRRRQGNAPSLPLRNEIDLKADPFSQGRRPGRHFFARHQQGKNRWRPF